MSLKIYSFSLLLSAISLSLSANNLEHKDWEFYLGFDAGYSHQSVKQSRLLELNKDGYQLQAKALFSKAWSRFSWDFGGGLIFSDLMGTSETPPLTQDDVRTFGGLIETSGRVRLNEAWEFGPLFTAYVGDDVGFNTTGDEKALSLFAGAQLMYRFHFHFPLRATASFLTDLNLKNRQVYTGLLGLQMGFGIDSDDKGASDKDSSRAPQRNFVQQTSPKPMLKKAPRAQPAPREKAEVMVAYDVNAIRFELGKHELDARSQNYFEALGGFLGNNPDLWQNLRIEGHTDMSGSRALNQELSQKRADAVTQALVKGGAPSVRLKSVGYAFDYLLVDDKPLAPENRRVELAFDKVKSKKVINQEIQRLQKLYFNR
jgi:outer membrane protein OmpA-like peptidoglycan-associated protein